MWLYKALRTHTCSLPLTTELPLAEMPLKHLNTSSVLIKEKKSDHSLYLTNPRLLFFCFM